MTDHVAHAEVTIDATPDEVWQALTAPDQVTKWMAGTELTTDWEVGGPITWKGEMDGKPYEDKGEVRAFEPTSQLVVTHYSPLMGQPDEPENYHTLTYELTGTDDGTKLTLAQDGNESPEQAEQFAKNWQQMLDALKSAAEAS